MSRREELGVREIDSEYLIDAIVDAIVEELCFSYTVVLKFQGKNDRSFRLLIGPPFQFFVGGIWREVDPEKLNTCNCILKLHTDTVTSLSVD